MMDFPSYSHSSSSSSLSSSLNNPCSPWHSNGALAPLLVRLHHFLDLYEDSADPAGVDCQNVLHSVVGAAALEKHHTIADLLDDACRLPNADEEIRNHNNVDECAAVEEREEEDSLSAITRGDDPETQSSALDTRVGHSTKDYSNFVVIEQSEIERIETEVRGRKWQEQERAVNMANQLHQTFSIWQEDGNAIRDEALVESSSSQNSSNFSDYTTLCQFLVDLELGKLKDKNLHGDWQSKDVVWTSDIGKENVQTTRSFSNENGMDDVAYHKLRRKLSYLLEFRGKLDEENWRSGVDMGLIFAYFKVLLEFLMNQTTKSVTDLAEMKHQLNEHLQSTQASLADTRCEVENMRTDNTILSCIDKITQKIESCENEILDCRNAWGGASPQSTASKAEFHERFEQADALRNELEGRLEKEAAEVTRLIKELELVAWEQEAKSLIYSEVVDGMSDVWLNLMTSTQKQQEVNVKTITQKLEEKWEHDVESSIYVEVLNHVDLLYSQERKYMNEKEGSFEEGLRKEAEKVKRLSRELEDFAWEHKFELFISLEIFDEITFQYSQEIKQLSAKLNMEQSHKARLQNEVKELNKRVNERENSSWKSTAESSIYFAMFDDTARNLSEEIEHLRAQLSNEELHKVRLRKEVKESKKRVTELENKASNFSEEIKHLRAQLNNEEVCKERLQKEVRELNKRVNELDNSIWKSTAESSIYCAMFDDTTRNLSEEIEHLRAQLCNEGSLLTKLQVQYAEVERSKKDLKRTSIEQKAESSVCLEIIDTIAQEWAQEVTKAMSEYKRTEGVLEGILEQKDLEIKRLSEELESTLWEHEAESSIYLEVAGERACEWRQVIDNLSGDLSRNEIVRRKVLQASCSFNGRTHKENLASEDASPLVHGDMEGLKSALRKPSPLKGLSTFSDQPVSSPGKATTDPIYVVVRRNTQAAVEGFMVDIGESPSKRTSKEVVSSLKSEVLDLRREKEQLIEHHSSELNKLEFELKKEREKTKVELEQECQNEIARLRLELETQFRKDTEQMKDDLNQKFQIQIAKFQEKLESEHREKSMETEMELRQTCQNEIAELQEKLDLEYRNMVEETMVEVEQRHLDKFVELQETLELAHNEELERVKVEVRQKHEKEFANLQQKLELEATKKGETKLIELEQKFQNEIAALEEKLVNIQQKLEQGLQSKTGHQSNANNGGDVAPENPDLSKSRESSDICLEAKGSIKDTLLMQIETEVVTLVAERDELCDRVSELELLISELQEKVTKLEGERSWLEERVPGLEKKLATEQSRLEDTVAGHAFERDQLKLIVSSHKNEQTKLENELAERKAERNYLATAIAMLAVACKDLKVSNQNERERWSSAYMMALKDMERALSRTQKQVKEERAQKGSAESDAQRMKAEIYTMQQESKDVWRHLERTIAEHISRAVGTSQQVEFGLCRKIHQQSMRFEAVQKQVNNLVQALRHSQMSKMDYFTVENFQRAEQEVDVLGDEVDSLVELLEKVHTVMCQYAPVLLHYPGVAEVAKLVRYELFQRDLLSDVPA